MCGKTSKLGRQKRAKNYNQSFLLHLDEISPFGVTMIPSARVLSTFIILYSILTFIYFCHDLLSTILHRCAGGTSKLWSSQYCSTFTFNTNTKKKLFKSPQCNSIFYIMFGERTYFQARNSAFGRSVDRSVCLYVFRLSVMCAVNLFIFPTDYWNSSANYDPIFYEYYLLVFIVISRNYFIFEGSAMFAQIMKRLNHNSKNKKCSLPKLICIVKL